ncbi:methyltransferase [Ferrimonas senticii]|uniref:methyltransferase n=1 Tax=Ferrimonas senticii TaxID=394566 RepID=UPI0004293C8E|nr:methyltransferase [Ferrimonas senticii]
MHASQLQQLTELLTCHRSLWWHSCYQNLNPDWLQTHQQLGGWLLALTDEQVKTFEDDHDQLINAASAWLPELSALQSLWQQPVTEAPLPKAINPRQFAHVPGRKLEQISQFVAALPASNGRLLEWCSGKGHLGRMFALQHDATITSVEYDQQLCDDGAQLAQRSGVNQQMLCVDALSEAASGTVIGQQRAVALHACGDLHLRLLALTRAAGTEQVAISPCCYHLTQMPRYRPLSGAGQALDFEKSHLRLAVAQTSTAPLRVQRLRAQELSYRYGLQALLADLLQAQPLPSFSKKVLSGEFSDFCHWAAGELALSLPANADFAGYLAQGKQQWHRYRRLELARQLFRPAIEMALVLDRACYMEEGGYSVSLSRFCHARLTPRNILLFAVRH